MKKITIDKKIDFIFNNLRKPMIITGIGLSMLSAGVIQIHAQTQFTGNNEATVSITGNRPTGIVRTATATTTIHVPRFGIRARVNTTRSNGNSYFTNWGYSSGNTQLGSGSNITSPVATFAEPVTFRGNGAVQITANGAWIGLTSSPGVSP